MILELQAKVHGLGYLSVSTYTYPIFSGFKAPKSDPFLPPFPHDQGAVGSPTLPGWLVDRLVG